MDATLHRVRQVKPIVKVIGRGINLRVRQPPFRCLRAPEEGEASEDLYYFMAPGGQVFTIVPNVK
jgi:hypothetical protein